MIVQPESFDSLIHKLKNQTALVIDVETDGLHPFEGNSLCGIGVGVFSGETYYFPFRHKNPVDQHTNLDSGSLKSLIETLNSVSVLIGFNIKFDLKFLINEGLLVEDKELIDVLVLARLTEPEQYALLNLTSLIEKHYGKDAGQYDHITKDELRKNKWNKDFSSSPISLLGPYCEQDVSWTRKLYFDKLEVIGKTSQNEIWAIEKRLTKVLLFMERDGIKIDKAYCLDKLNAVEVRMKTLEDRIFKQFGSEFNIASPSQVGKAFNSVGFTSPIITEVGNQSWNEMVLLGIDHPSAGLIREWRTLSKMRKTYLEPFLAGPDMIRTSFHNWGTITGRLSSREPNIQNIPRFNIPLSDIVLDEEAQKELRKKIQGVMRSKKGGAQIKISDNSSLASWGFTGNEIFDESKNELSIRRIFIPRSGYKLISFDYSQMEIRVFLSYLNNKDIVDLMKIEGFDFHSHAANIAFGVTKEDPDFKFYRQMAKSITFGVIYGIGLDKLAIQMGNTREEAKAYKDKYFMGITGARDFIKKVNNTVKTRGYVFNRFKRKYWIPEDYSYVGVNYLIQGSSADLLSQGMCQVYDKLRGTGDRMLIQVHDEIICELREETYLERCAEIKKILENNPLEIPLEITVSICDPSWAHKKELVL